ncbi:MAG: HD domain-containing protein, partial [Kiritimatiellaeota bacterium]|nr:HD domain-containing protein [Kiritimatiellota bacterium]
PEGDVWRHTLLMLDGLPPPPRDLALTLATLLHDAGKPPTFQRLPGADGQDIIRFMGHAAVGAAMARDILARLRQPAALADEVAEVVRDHMTFHELRNMRPATLRRFLGKPTFQKALEVNRLDLLHSVGDLADNHFARAKFEAFASEPVLPAPWVTGRDLIAAGLAPGVAFGVLLKRAYDAQLEEKFPGKEALLRDLLR